MESVQASGAVTLLICGATLIGGGLCGSLITWWIVRYQRIAKSQIHHPHGPELPQPDAKIRRLIEANLIGVYVADFSGRIFESNDAFLSMVGYTREDLYAGQMNWVEMTPSQYRPLDQQALEEQESTGVCTPFEKEYYRRDGTCVPVLFGCAVFDSVLKRSIGFVVDLSQQKRTEAMLRRSEAKFKRFVDANLIGVAESHFNGKFFEANDAFLNMVGYSREDLNAGCLNWLQMTPPDYLEVDHQATTALRATGTFHPFEKEYFRKDGSRVPILLGHVAFDPEQEISIGFILDLTDRKRAELASVLEERNRIAREIHDTLAQSFTGILTHLEVASLTLATEPATAEMCLQTSYALAQTGLAEARRSVVALRPQSLEQQDLYAALCLLAKQMFDLKQTKLVCTCEGDRYPLQPSVEDHLLRMGQEALMNASKYAEATEVQLHLRYEPTRCILQVKDNGQGFVWSGQPTPPRSGDRGFGLVGMQERADRMGAHLTIQTAPGQGAEVQVEVTREQTDGCS
jgi:PAS domain S-box-containing protein